MDDTKTHLGYVIVGAAGGATRYLQRYLDGHRFEVSKLVAEAIVGAFTGWICAHFVELVKPEWVGLPRIAAGVAGWMGVKAVSIVANFFITRASGSLVIEDDEPKRPRKRRRIE